MRWDTNQITRNDLRVLMGLALKDEPYFNEYLAPDVIAQVRENNLRKGVELKLSRNILS